MNTLTFNTKDKNSTNNTIINQPKCFILEDGNQNFTAYKFPDESIYIKHQSFYNTLEEFLKVKNRYCSSFFFLNLVECKLNRIPFSELVEDYYKKT